MKDKGDFHLPLDDEQLDDINAGGGFQYVCGISESQFPQQRKCCNQILTLQGTVYEKICPYCSIWTSLPEGGSLKVAHIIECTLYNYGKRIKE